MCKMLSPTFSLKFANYAVYSYVFYAMGTIVMKFNYTQLKHIVCIGIMLEGSQKSLVKIFDRCREMFPNSHFTQIILNMKMKHWCMYGATHCCNLFEYMYFI